MLFAVLTAWPLGRKDSAVVENVLGRIVRVAFVLEVVASCPFDCTAQIVVRGKEVVQLDDLSLGNTCWCCCRPAGPVEQLVGIDPMAHQLRIVPELPNELAPCAPGLEQLELFVCSKPQLAVVAGFPELVTG